jgi:DNA polymerase-3 subunit gamma/tau
MRDALSLTDQAIAFGDGVLGESQVRAMLGSVDRDHVLKLLDALALGKPAGLLQAMDEVFGYHPDALSLLDDLVSHFHQLAVEQIVPGRSDARLVELAQRFQAEQLQLYYDIAVRGRPGLAQLNDGKSGLEMLLLRMLLFRPEGVLVKAPLAGEDATSEALVEDATAKKSLAAVAAQPQPEPTAEPAPVVDVPVAVEEPPAPVVAQEETPLVEEAPPVLAVQEVPADYRTEPAPAPGKDDLDGWWMDLLPRLQLTGSVLGVAANSRLVRRDSGHWQLALAEDQRFWVTEERTRELCQGIRDYFGRDVKLEWQFHADVSETPAQRAERQRQARQQALERLVTDDARTQALLAEFDGKLIDDSIRPLTEEPHHGF